MDKINKNLVLTIIIIIFLVSIISGCEDNIGGEAIESNSDTKDSKLNPKLEGITSEEKIISDTSKEQEKIVLNNEMRIPTTKEIKFPLNKNDRDMVITLEGIPGTWIGIVSPVLYDLDDDGDQELIVQTQESDNSKLYIISYEGEIIHEVFLDCFINPRSFPSIADINNDNLPEIVVFCYDGPNEQSQFKILNNEGILIDTWNVEYGISDDLYSSINLLDLNNDGTTEIIYGGYNGYESALVVLDNEGEVMNGFPITLEGIDSSEAMTPAIGNLNNDSNKEIVAISRNDGVDSMWLTEDDESYIRAYNINGEELWNQTIIGDRIGSDPVIADINNNGDNEIIFSSSKGLRVLNNQGDYDLEYIISDSMTMSRSNIALGDFDNDDDLEIIFGNGYDLYAIHHTGEEIFIYENEWHTSHPPIIADVNSDNDLDIIFNSNNNIKALNINGELVDGFPKQLGSIIAYSSPSISDIDNDGYLELVSSSNWADLNVGLIHIWDLEVSYSFETAPWPQYQHDERHIGNYHAQCNDKTFLGECSFNKPLFCENENLINNCQECGCPPSKICKENGNCELEVAIINNTIPQIME